MEQSDLVASRRLLRVRSKRLSGPKQIGAVQSQCLRRVKLRRTLGKAVTSALPPITDVVRPEAPFAFAPQLLGAAGSNRIDSSTSSVKGTDK